jgi:hypothetical protein
MTTETPAVRTDRRTGTAAVAAGLLLSASVAAELVRPVQRSDGSVTDLPGFLGYVALWTLGAAALVVAIHGLGTDSRAGAIGRGLALAGAGLLTAFGAVGLITAAVGGAPAEESFLLFAVGLLLLVLGAVPFTLGLGSRLGGWRTAVLAAGAGGAVALLAEADPWHDLGLFVFDAAWIVVGLHLVARTSAGTRHP